MTQTIEQLQARVAELEAENARLRDGAVCGDCDGSGWLENRVEGRYPCTCMTEAEPYQLLTEQLAAAQAEIKRLRDALAWAKSGFNQASMGIIIQRELEELFNLCRDALASPPDTSALDAYVAEKVKEATTAIGFDEWESNPYRAILQKEIATLTRQRDLAVESIGEVLHYIDDRNEMRLMDEHVTDDDEANSAIEYNEQLDSAVNQMRTTLSTIKESEVK